MSIDTYVEEFDFGEFQAVLKRHWLPAALVFVSLPALAVVYLILKSPTYLAQGEILVEVDRKASLTGGVAEEVGSIENLSFNDNPVSSQLEILQSVVVIGDTINELRLRDGDGELLSTTDFKQDLSTERVTGTAVIEIGYRSADPEKAAEIVNTLMDMYLRNNAENNQSDVMRAREFIENQLPRSEATVQEAETALRQFRERNGILDLQQESSATSTRLATLEDQAAALRIQLSAAEQRKELLRNQLGLSPERVLEVVDLASSPGIQRALANVQDVQSRLATEQARFQENSPLVLGLQSELDQMQLLLSQRVSEQLPGQVANLNDLELSQLRTDLITQYVQTDLDAQSLASQISAIESTLVAARERASVLPELEQNHRELERQLSAAQGTYEQLLTRLSEVQAAENQTVNNARVISPALVPRLPESNKATLLIAAAGFVGGLLAIAVAFSLDLMDTSVKSTRDVNKLFNYRALANVPDLAQSQLDPLRLPLQFARSGDRSKLPAPFTPASAAFHALQTNLNFTKPDSAPQSIAVVSSLSKEGKTTVAANLACIMAQNQFRTLLIDGDLFHPKQHEVWELSGDTGLSQVLEGETKLMWAIRSVMPNLDILPNVAQGKNLAPDYNKFRSMLTQLAAMYDRIILDTPPLLMSADGGILAGMTDGAVMVARPGILDVSSANMVKSYLDDSDISILGLVVNGQRDEIDRYASYYR